MRYLNTVSDDKQASREGEQEERTQKTLKGTEIPVPARKSIFDALKKVSEPKK